MKRSSVLLIGAAMCIVASPCSAQSSCAADCPTSACRADVNDDGVIDSRDFFQFLGSWFAGLGDYNCNGVVDSQDFFCFLTEFFDRCPDIGVTGVSVPAGLVCGDGSTTASVTLVNRTGRPVSRVPVVVRFGSNEARAEVDLPGSSEPFMVNLPIMIPACGDDECDNFNAALEARIDMEDPTPGDNHISAGSQLVLGRYWHLEYNIVGEPTLPVGTGTRITYTVRIRNTGTIRSPEVDSRTAICTGSSCSSFSRCIGCDGGVPVEFEVDRLDPIRENPNARDDYEVSYFICCGACIGQQYIKAGPDQTLGTCGSASCVSNPICVFPQFCPGGNCVPSIPPCN